MDKDRNIDFNNDLVEPVQTICNSYGWKYRGWKNPLIGETIKKFYWNEFRILKDGHACLYGIGIDCCGE